MEFYIFVLVLFFVCFNHCDSTTIYHNRIQVNTNNFHPQALFPSTSQSNQSDSDATWRVEILDTPYKLENDRKLYRMIRLNNGLTALLISTQENEYFDSKNSNKTMEHLKIHKTESACSLVIDVGHFSDPRDAQGLSHFIEHTVFLGSKKYPGEHEFNRFVQKSGGDMNGGTSYDYTEFDFHTHEEYLDEALDRFSHLFKEPLMLKESILRDREIIESEFASAKNDDDARHARLLSSLGETQHPLTTFKYGNLKSLKENITDDELYRKVVEFRKRHYSAHRMYLGLQSNHSLDNLQEMVVRHFSTIPNNKMPGEDFAAFTHLNAFQPKFHEKVYYVKPIRSGSKIVITWCLEPMIKKLENNPLYILRYLLAREGKGSLLSYLRKKHWATELFALEENNIYKLYTFFDIAIHLTENGLDHLDDVLEAIFSYLKFLQSANLDDSIFSDTRTAFWNMNRFPLKLENLLDSVKRLTWYMSFYPSRYVVRAPDYLFNYDAASFKKTIDYMNLRKFNIMITLNRRNGEKLVYDSVEPWFGVEYTEIDMPANWIELHQKAKPFPEFTLPESKNPFFADNFSIFDTKADANSVPQKLLDNEFCQLWYRESEVIQRPLAYLMFTFVRPYAETSIDNEVQMTLLAALLKSRSAEKLYPASVAGISHSCYQSSSGIAVQFEGLNQQMHLAVDIFSKTLKSLADGPTVKEFKMIVLQQFEIYEKEILDPAYVNRELHLSVLQSHYHPLWEKHQHLRSISFPDFQQFCRNFCAQVKIEAFMHGNIDKNHAMKIMENLLNDFQCERIKNSTTVTWTAKKIPIGTHYLRVRNFNSKDANSVVLNSYQIAPKSHHIDALLNLLNIIAQAPVFDILRERDQLAYHTSFVLNDGLENRGYSIFIYSQQTKFTTDYVDKRIENFRHELLTIIEQMSLAEFETFKSALVKNKWVEYDKNIENNEWNKCSDKERFDCVKKEVDYLLTITKEQLLEFYRAHLYVGNQRKLSIQVIGNAHANSNDTVVANSIDTLKYVHLNGEPNGIQINDLMKFRNSLEDYDDIGEEESYEEFLQNSIGRARA